MPYQPAVLGTARLNNFRLNYLSAALQPIRDWRVLVWLDGEPVRHRVRVGSVTIHDVLNDAPNTASWRMDGLPAPEPGMVVRITINTNAPRLLFNGTLETTTTSYEGKPAQVIYACSATDDTRRADNRRPFALYPNLSATTVAIDLVARFAPGLTADHVQAGLPWVTVAFDGTEGFNGCLRAICKIIGGYFYWEDGDLHLFLEEATQAPDPLTPTTASLYLTPPIASVRDDSQLRTRVYGRGYGSTLLLDVPATETILPIANAALFTPGGGRLIASPTADGSPTDRLTYTGVLTGGTATVVGPGVTPGGAPVLTVQEGAGLAPGVYRYGYTWGTATGETLPGPVAAITLAGVLDPPPTAPTFVRAAGPELALGDYWYGLTCLNSVGETVVGPVAGLATLAVAAPTAAPSATSSPAGSFPARVPTLGWPHPGDAVTFRVANFDAAGGQTLVGPASLAIIAQNTGGNTANMQVSFPAESAPGVAYRRAYLYANGVYTGFSYVGPSGPGFSTASEYVGDVMGWFGGPSATPPQAPIGVATAKLGRVTVALALGPAGTTARRLYRTPVNAFGTLKLVTTIADNTTTAYLDAVPDGSLGAAAPSTNTALMARVLASGIGIGPGGTTQRTVYRSIAHGTQLKVQQTIANNTVTTAVVDTSPDGSLGATAPSTDTSGLTQPTGQVSGGSTTLLTAGAPFPPSGGYVLVGTIPVRYTGISGNTLTGIPATGPGALLVPVPYGTPVVLAPALMGVAGLIRPLLTGAAVHIFAQRDDLAAQAAAAARESTATYAADGIHEHLLTDERRGEPSLTALCDADLVRFGYPLVTVQYVSQDVKTKSGKPIAINLTTPPIVDTLTIHEVTISQLDIADGVPARFATTASSVRFSLEDLLRRMSALLPE